MVDSLTESIKDDPDRFMTDMDLREIFDKESFNREIEHARLRCQRAYSRGCDRWMRKSNVLFDTGRVQKVMIENVDKNTITLRKKHGRTGQFVRIQGYDMGDGTFLITRKSKGLDGKTVKFVVRRKGRTWNRTDLKKAG